MSNDNGTLSPPMAAFPIKLPEVEATMETIKWSEGGAKYETHLTVLSSLELAQVISHCLAFRQAIRLAVDNVAHIGPSLYKVFPRTISMVLRTVWDQINSDATINPAIDNTETSDHFDDRIREFVAVHCTEADHYDLVQQLRSMRKPVSVSVVAFYYRLKELNQYVEWLPGTEPPLSGNQMKQAFHDAMPAKWRERFTSAGHSVATQTLGDLLSYFGRQEAQAVKQALENQAKMKRQGHASRAQQRQKGVAEGDSTNKNKRSSTFKKRKSSFKKGNGGGENAAIKQPTGGTRMGDDEPCPVHPQGNHVWGDCFLNASNTKRPGNKNGGPKKVRKVAFTKSDSNAASASVNVNNVMVVEEQRTDETDAKVQSLLNMDPNEEEEILKSMKDLDLRQEKKKGKQAKRKESSTDTGMFVCDAFVTTDIFPLTHHLDVVSPISVTQNKDSIACACAFDESFISFSNELYEAGVDGVSLNPIVDELQSLRLRAISIMNIAKVQKTPTHAPFRVLFDTGADLTMFNRNALPKGARPANGKDHNVSGIHGMQLMNQEVMLEDIVFPEFSATQKVPGPIRAIVFQNDHSNYDVILGMDVLQPLGFKIDCDTNTIQWNDNIVPFRPSDYFDKIVFTSTLFDDEMDDLVDDTNAPAIAGYKSKTILPSHYEEVDTDKIARQQVHLSPAQQFDLAQLLGSA